jgi:hypothetical protein
MAEEDEAIQSTIQLVMMALQQLPLTPLLIYLANVT